LEDEEKLTLPPQGALIGLETAHPEEWKTFAVWEISCPESADFLRTCASEFRKKYINGGFSGLSRMVAQLQ
jgi:hypothetical protein